MRPSPNQPFQRVQQFAPRRRRVAGDPRWAGNALFDWFKGVRWSVSYVAFLVYIFSLVTMRLPVGTESMIIALLGLPMEKTKFKFPIPAMLLLGFFLWSVLGYTISPYKPVVWESLVQLFKAGVIMVVAINVLTDWKRLRVFILVFLGAFLFYPGRGSILFWASGAYTVFGRAIWLYIYENPNDLAGLTFLPMACALYLLAERGHKLARLSAIAAAGVCAFVIVITQSRGAMLALIGMGAISFAGHHKKLRAVFTGVLLVGVIAMFAPANVMDRFIGLVTSDSIEEADPENSAAGRWAIWKVSLNVFAARPVTGWGLGAYRFQHAEITRGRRDILGGARGRRDTHSTYLRVLGETGFVGLGLLMALMLSVIQKVTRALKRVARFEPEKALQLQYIRNAFLGFMLAAVFASYHELAFLYVHLATMWAAAVLAERAAAAEKPARKRAGYHPRPRAAVAATR